MADPGGGATEELEWQFLQCFGQPTENEEIQEGPLFSACECRLWSSGPFCGHVRACRKRRWEHSARHDLWILAVHHALYSPKDRDSEPRGECVQRTCCRPSSSTPLASFWLLGTAAGASFCCSRWYTIRCALGRRQRNMGSQRGLCTPHVTTCDTRRSVLQ